MGERRHGGRQAHEEEVVPDEAPTTPGMTLIDMEQVTQWCAIIDGRVDEVSTVAQAQRELHKVTQNVREVLEHARPLLERKEVLETEIARLEQRKTELAATVEADYAKVHAQQQELATLQAHVAEAQRLRDELTALR